MTNLEYLNKMGAESRYIPAALDAMSKSPDKWWLNPDIRQRAYGQLYADTILIPYSDLQKGLVALLQRPVWSHEFRFERERLQREASERILDLALSHRS